MINNSWRSHIGIREKVKKYIPRPPSKINPEPKDWARKYFMAASVCDSVEEIIIIGIKDNILISSPAQINTHEEEEIARIEPNIREKQKNIA